MNRRAFLTTAGTTLASVSLAGCIGQTTAGGGSETTTTTTTTTEGDTDIDLSNIDGVLGDSPENLTVTKHRLVETDSGAAVVGTVKNTGNQAYEFVEVEVTLNDGDTIVGEWVDTSEKEIDNLACGETWQFRATFDDEEVRKATGYTINLDGDLE